MHAFPHPHAALETEPQDGAGAVGSVLAVDGARLVCGLDVSGSLRERVIIGGLMAVPTPVGTAVAVVHAMRHGRRGEDFGILELQLLGELTGEDAPPVFRRGISRYPVLGAPIRPACEEEERTVYAVGDRAAVELGRLRHDPRVPVSVLVDELLGKHFAVLGSTGCGKSSAVALLVHRLVERYPDAHVVVIDPHDEYAAAFGERAMVLDPASLELPYWLLTFEELAAILAPGDDERTYAERAILKDAVLKARQRACRDGQNAEMVSVDVPVPYRLSELEEIINERLGTLDKPEGAAPYRHLLSRLASARTDPRYEFLFPKLAVRDNMAAILGRLFRIPANGRPITVLNTAGMASEIVDVVVSVLCRLVFEYGLWSDRERMRPVLLVCEEAHRYVPDDPSLGFAPSRRAIDRLAKEGRKYGVSLCLVSQRPAELSASALSQCGTVFALRMSNERDQAFIERVLPDGSAWMLRALPALAAGEALIVGEGVPVPVTVRLDPLPADRRPASATPSFAGIWGRPPEDHGTLLEGAIARWRRQKS